MMLVVVLVAFVLAMAGPSDAASRDSLENTLTFPEVVAMTGSGPAEEFTVTPISVDCGKEIGKLRHFWQSTGFTPAKALFKADKRQMMIYMASIPHGAITYVRPHDLLELIKVEGFGTPDQKYDWSELNQILDFFAENGLKPFFEIMGIPEGVEEAKTARSSAVGDGFVNEEASDYPKEVQQTFKRRLDALTPEEWRRLTRDVALHCIERYGREEVRNWYFETWNEPEGYREALWHYYDACSAGLNDVDPKLKFGGPGTYKTLDTTFTGLLEHCDRGKNYFTGETGTKMDFISVHEKGTKRSGQFTDASPVLKEWIDREIATIKYIRANHPRFANTLYVNNECDPKGGYWHPYTWYSSAYYPAIIAKYIDHHLRRIVDVFGIDTMISNDNAYVGHWGTRSHVTQFGDAKQFDLIKRPINAGFAMLTLLGDRRYAVDGPDLFSDVGAIATRGEHDQVAVLIYNCNETGTREKHDDAKWVLEKYGTAKIELDLKNLPFDEAMLVHYRIDKDHTNPYSLWQKMGEPKEPTPEQIAQMRLVQELALLEEPKTVHIRDGNLTLDFLLPMPGVSLLLLVPKRPDGPGKVQGLRTEQYTGSDGSDQIMLIWKELPSKGIRTYEVLQSDSPDGAFTRISESDNICTAYLYVKEKPGIKSYYRIRAIDYWGRVGPESEAISHPT
jgi:L-iduronidase